MNEKKVSSLSYEIETIIDGSPDRVWHALTRETNDWWLPDFHMVAPDSVVAFDLSPGGHLLERHAGGGGLLWYTVQMCIPGKSLDLFGHISPEFGGPAISMLGWKLTPVSGKTRLLTHDALLGCVTEKGAQSLEDGWKQLLEQGLKNFVEAAART